MPLELGEESPDHDWQSNEFLEDGPEDDDGQYEEEDGHGLDIEGNAQVRRKLHLFQCRSVRQSIKRIWDQLPLHGSGGLAMEGYIELNLRFQKCLTQDFVLERAAESAIGDWSEDVQHEQKTMTYDEFAMFLFELCSLWCGPTISITVYLLFLNSAFIAITEARGSHTVGLKQLKDVERLPQSFFDLLGSQGWAGGKEQEAASDDERALSAWTLRNISPQAQHGAMMQVQRQVFQVTHDARAVLLFKDGQADNEEDVMKLVKLASSSLANIAPVELKTLGVGAAVAKPRAGSVGRTGQAELNHRPWCPSNWARPPLVGQGLTAQRVPHSTALALPAPSPPAAKEPNSQSIRALMGHATSERDPQLHHPAASSRPPREAVPVGRAFDTRRSRPAVRGLMMAGQAAVGNGSEMRLASLGSKPSSVRSMSAGASAIESQLSSPRGVSYVEASSRPGSGVMGMTSSSRDFRSGPMGMTSDSGDFYPGVIPSAGGPTQSATLGASRLIGGSGSAGLSGLASSSYAHHSLDPVGQTRAIVAMETTSETRGATIEARPTDTGGTCGWTEEGVLNAVVGAPFLPPYRLPSSPKNLYRHQTESIMRVKPNNIVHEANKWTDQQHLAKPHDFERALRKLPESVRPGPEGPVAGRMSHPNEPVWFQMGTRLQSILQKQGKRAERKKKRRLKSKLLHGRSSLAGPRRDEGRELREYLDTAAESAPPVAGEAGGEFLGRVHERYLLRRDHADKSFGSKDAEFRVRGTGGDRVDNKSIGDSASAASGVVRPTYLPPPASAHS